MRIRIGFQLNPTGEGDGSDQSNKNEEVIFIDTSIRLTFRTADAKAVVVNVPRANPSITGAKVRTAMDRILAADVIATSAGIPVTVDKAELIGIEEFVYTV